MGMQGATGGIYRYYDQFRWTGMWDSPNTFGLLMGVGVVLALGVLLPIYVQTAGPQDGDDHFFLPEGKVNYRHMLLPALFAFATGCLGLGLFESYSRGAWCATFLGFCHWMWRNHQISKSKVQSDPGSPISHSFSISRSLAISLSIVVILASVCLLCFWQFRQTEWHPARRAFSAARTEDFSWRNRVAAWEGDWQMMAEHPWFGTGWNQPEPLYEHYYLSPKLTERAAIEMNDYLLLGATLGGAGAVWFCRVSLAHLEANPGGRRGDEAQIKTGSEPPRVGGCGFECCPFVGQVSGGGGGVIGGILV